MSKKISNVNEDPRIWLMVAYPENMRKNWYQILTEAGVQGACSPLHNLDVWEASDEATDPEHVAGTLKKAHYHFVFRFEGKCSRKKIEMIRDAISLDHPCGFPVPCLGSIEGAIQYLDHTSAPEKHQYNRDDIVGFGNYDWQSKFILSSAQENELFLYVINFCRQNNITEYCDLVDWAYDIAVDQHDVSNYIRKHTIMLNSYVTSRRNKIKEKL